MADQYLERAIAQPLDRLVTFSIQHNLQRRGGDNYFNVATRQGWARRERVAVSAQLQPLLEGSEIDNVSRWLIRNEVYQAAPTLVEGQAWLTDDDGNEWRIVGLQPVGRRLFMELYCLLSETGIPVDTPPP